MLLVPFLKCCWGWIISTLTLARPAAVLGVGAIALLSGCNMVSLGYNRLPDLGVMWLNSQLPLTDEQAAQARIDMVALLAWHRHTQLPATADLLRHWQGLATGDISADQACREWDRVRVMLDTLTQQAVPAMARLASGITAEQLYELQRTQRKNNHDFRETYSVSARSGWFAHATATTEGAGMPHTLNAQAGLDKRLDSLRDRYHRLYGPLSDVQTALLRDKLQASPFQPERSLAERERRQVELLGALRQIQNTRGQASDAAIAPSAVRAWLAGWGHPPSPGDAAYARQLVRDGCAQFASLHRTTTPEQRSHAVRTLRDHEQTLRALAQH